MYYQGGYAPFASSGISKPSTLKLTLYDTATHCNTQYWRSGTGCTGQLSLYAQAATHYSTRNTMQHTATHCNTLQHTATYCNTLQHTATHCNTLNVVALQHTATHCSTLQHTVTHSALRCVAVCCSMRCSALQCVAGCQYGVVQCVAVCSGVLQCVAMCSGVVQCVAVCSGVLQCVAA